MIPLQVKVLGIAGSARHGGNTEALLDRALDGTREAGAITEKIVLLDLKLNPCICSTSEDCMPEGICSVMDDMQGLYPKLLECDLLFVASPIFFRSVSAQLKTMIDRCQAVWVRKYRLKQDITPGRSSRRPGLFIAVSGERGEQGFQAAGLTVRALFATLNVGYTADLLVPRIGRQAMVLRHPEHLKQAYDLGFRLVREEISSHGSDAR